VYEEPIVRYRNHLIPDSPDCRLAGANSLSLQTSSQRNSPAKTRFCGKSVSPPISGHWLIYAAEGVPLPAVRAFDQRRSMPARTVPSKSLRDVGEDAPRHPGLGPFGG
jgi:hypothetical protein